ncbi:MAG TPA: peptidase M61, partial [Bacteroidetes bacterium]|nr:peptidase M61 [Bacteroidota bacterium]
LEGQKELPITLKITKPKGFYGSTSLIAKATTATEDTYEIAGYNDLADSPLMYCLPDTSVRMVGGAEILVSVYSPNKRVRASAVMESLAEILAAQKEYLGGTLPVEKYAFLIYLTPGMGGGGMGALEHSYSSMYFMPESEEKSTAKMLRSVAAHEFFHIVTPLSIHSEEIHYFDFIDPKMSRHLWLYEGMTEYSAGLVQVKYDLISTGDYLRGMQQKITMSSFFIDSIPFTEISAGCLHKYKSQYLNVYQKGALIGMSLDILLRDLSGGEMGIQELLRALSKTYGKDNPFKDGELFAKIVELTFPEVEAFLSQYVAGTEKLPFEKIFKSVGIIYKLVGNEKVLSTGRVSLRWDKQEGKYEVLDVNKVNKFGKKLGYKKGDYIASFDGEALNINNFDEVIARYRGRHKAGDKIFVEVLRAQANGSRKLTKLKGKAVTTNIRGMNLLMLDPNATEAQRALRKAWLEPKGN